MEVAEADSSVDSREVEAVVLAASLEEKEIRAEEEAMEDRVTTVVETNLVTMEEAVAVEVGRVTSSVD